MKELECEHCGSILVPEMVCCPRCGEDANHSVPTELRCECGFLLSKLSEDSVEIKCRRCKRLVEIPIPGLSERFQKLRDQKRLRSRAQRPARPRESCGQQCSDCGQTKQSLLYGKCIDCRTKAIKVQYKGKAR